MAMWAPKGQSSAGFEVYLAMDNYVMHKAAKVRVSWSGIRSTTFTSHRPAAPVSTWQNDIKSK